MSQKKCINLDCKSSPLEQLVRAPWSACRYYRVQFKLYHRVCEKCLKKSEEYHCGLQKSMINQQCVFDLPASNEHELVDLTDDNLVDMTDGGDNVASVPLIQTAQERLLADLTVQTLNDMTPLIDKQLTVCWNCVNEVTEKRKEEEQRLHKKIDRLDKELSDLHNSLYKFDGYIQYDYEPEVIIQNSFKELQKPNDLPPKGISDRHEIKIGNKVYANKCSGSLPWVEGTVIGKKKLCSYTIKFSDDKSINDFGLTKVAYKDASAMQYEFGSRVIAIFHDSNPNMTNKFYPGIIAEIPRVSNSFRYLIFFDDGYAQYTCHKEVRLVCYQSPDVSADVDSNSQAFIKSYLEKYPEILMVKCKKNQKVVADYEGRWQHAKVLSIDGSLVQLNFIETENEHTEWIYRGSNRLELIYKREINSPKSYICSSVLKNVKKKLRKPYVELEYEARKEVTSIQTGNNQPIVLVQPGVVQTLEIPPCNSQLISFKDHNCSYSCLSWVNYDVDHSTAFNILSIPLHYGFQRCKVETENLKQKLIYITPCGRKIHYEKEMYNYLKATLVKNQHCLSIDMFDFDCLVYPLNFYKVLKFSKFKDDISGGLEPKPISAVNCLDESMPPEIEYITKRKIMPGVNLNLDPKFLSGCDCTDNCEDKTKCSCWQQTVDGEKRDLERIGYQFKRLYERVDTGIFECNTNCKCSVTCLNRVVQQPMFAMLQVFKTENKGWGLRTLVDMPKGSFIFNYIGEIYKENDMEMIAINTEENGEYVSNLDYVEMVEEIKDGYENDVVNPPDLKSDSVALLDIIKEEDTSLNLDLIKTNELKFRTSLKNKNIQHSNTEVNGKHKLSKLNSQQTSVSEISNNIFYRQYFDQDGTYVINSKSSGNVGRYINHSCDPNVFVQNVFVDSHDLRFPWQSYFASCFIPAGTELVYDYGYEVGSVKGVTVWCYCGSKNCNGRLL